MSPKSNKLSAVKVFSTSTSVRCVCVLESTRTMKAHETRTPGCTCMNHDQAAWPRIDRTKRRAGLTLVEVLVVISIIGVLVSLTLPAVQQARTAAQRMACRANLKEIGIALQNYHDSHSCFPPGYNSTRTGPSEPGWGWPTMLLPQLEQGALYMQLNPGPVILRDAVANQLGLVQTHLSVFRCPADTGSALGDPLRRIFKNSALQSAPVARSNFVGVNGPFLNETRAGFEGVFGNDSSIRLEQLTDGTSQTLLVGERRSRGSRSAVWCGVNTTSAAIGSALDHFGPVFVLGATSHPLNAESGSAAWRGFSSEHTGGSLFLFADGSVRFLAEHIDADTLRYLGHRSDARALNY